MTTEQRLEALGRAGMQGVAVVRFTHEMSAWDPETFVRTVLVEWLHVVEVWVGANFLFGHDRAGTFSVLRTLGRALRVPRREDRRRPLQGLRRQQHAHPPADRRGARRRGGRAARPSLLHRRHRRARRRARTRDRVSRRRTWRARTSCCRRPASMRRPPSVDGIEHPSVTNIGTRPTFGDGGGSASRRTCWTGRGISTTRGCACRSCSGCATSARSPTWTRCARRSTPTAGRPAGCSTAFRYRIDGWHLRRAASICG